MHCIVWVSYFNVTVNSYEPKSSLVSFIAFKFHYHNVTSFKSGTVMLGLPTGNVHLAWWSFAMKNMTLSFTQIPPTIS